VHRFVNDIARPIGTYLLGRRMYEVLVYWENPPELASEPDVIRDFAAIWRGTNKVVYSTTLDKASTARTRVEREFDVEAVRRLKSESATDLSVGGPHLAAQAIKSGLVDELSLTIAPVIVGGGNVALPDDLRLDLTLVDERRFKNGFVHLHYRVGRDFT
jgi:dihydrofolate reductase